MEEDNLRRDIDLLERYLSGDISQEEQKLVENRLVGEPSFFKLMEILRKLAVTLRKDRLKSILALIRSQEDKFRE